MNVINLQRRVYAEISYWANVICLVWIAAAHIGSFWNVALINEPIFAVMMVTSLLCFMLSILHRHNRLYVARFGHKQRFYGMLNFTPENTGWDFHIMMNFFFRYVSTSRVAMPYAPRWLVWLCWVMFLVMAPYGFLHACSVTGYATDMIYSRASIWLTAPLFYSLPILTSWRRELIIDPDA